MKNLILVAVILQLVITISLQTYEFGDMITLERKCLCRPFTYKHFVIYVDDEPDIPGRAQGQDIFHRTGEKGGHDCKFGVLANEKGDNVKAENYLDGKYGLSKGSDNEIRTRIQAMISQCKEYRVFTNNCEHLATFVRYGKMFLQQPGTFAGLFCNKKPKECSEINALVEEMERNAELEEKCLSECKDSAPNAG